MLTELRIENFAIIDNLEIRFLPGLIIFTGETGAGKSIIIDAVELLLGSRADATMIRSGAEKALIDAVFELSGPTREPTLSILEREELMDNPDYLTLGREIRDGGRSIARVNGRIVNVSILKEIGENLVDLHGQSEHLSLMRVKEHLSLLDRFSSDQDSIGNYSRVYKELLRVRKELKDLKSAEKEAARRLDVLDYQINEIHSAKLHVGEEDNLLAERNRLANAESIASAAQRALVHLEDGTPESPSILDMLGEVIDEVREISHHDKSQSELSVNLEENFSNLSDFSRELRNYLEEIEFNPQRLNQVEERLELISNLKRKYGSTIEEILSYLEIATSEKDAITNADERIHELVTIEASLLTQLAKSGEALSKVRHQSAQDLEKKIETELIELNMDGAKFKVEFNMQPDPNGVSLKDGDKVAFYPDGLEKIEFLIAPNPGEGLKPLIKIASGGETSRLMLALKNVLAKADDIPTLIFDEIDQGIGGRVGTVVGKKLWNLARHHQVLCVTHLPQLAAFGEQHFQVMKQIENSRTLTSVSDLKGDARIPELAQMLGETSQGTLQSASDMLTIAANLTNPEYESAKD
jgi:DNA repair protein RecN (Recombination protein N)